MTATRHLAAALACLVALGCGRRDGRDTAPLQPREIASPAPAGSAEGNLHADPMFVNSATNDYRLKRGGPCIDRGLNEAWMGNAKDLDGVDRIRGGKVDMGVYEGPPRTGSLMTIR